MFNTRNIIDGSRHAHYTVTEYDTEYGIILKLTYKKTINICNLDMSHFYFVKAKISYIHNSSQHNLNLEKNTTFFYKSMIEGY